MTTPKRERISSTIVLPAERSAQLRTFAEAEGITIVELIERWINAEIAAERFPDILPNFEVTAVEGRVWFTVKDFSFPTITPVQAEQMADTLLEMAEAKDATSKNAVFGTAGDEISLKVTRKAHGVLLSCKDIQTELAVKASLTSGMARDLARIIRNEAAKAAKHYAEDE